MKTVDVPLICMHSGCKAEMEVSMEVSGSDSESAWYVRTCLPHFFVQAQRAAKMPVSGVRTVKVLGKNDKEFRTLLGCY